MADQITVTVDPKVAEVYRSASDDERRKLDLLVNLRLREATQSRRPLRAILLEVSREAQHHGLTPEVLQSILDDKYPVSSSTPTSSSVQCSSAMK